MNYDVLYVGLADRKRQVSVQETFGRRMISDTFAPGLVNAGTMVFTDDPGQQKYTPQDPIEAKVYDLHDRIKKLEPMGSVESEIWAKIGL